ncbi:MAG: hypothetical protein AAF321_05290 [Pseudomonadota bacterium]
MNRRDIRLIDVLEPVRDLSVSELLEAMARSLDAGHDVHAEPKTRNQAGQPLREGRLALPSRYDLLVRHKGGALPREIQGGSLLHFEPITLVEPDGFVCVIGPFRWDAAHVIVEDAVRPASSGNDPRGAGFDIIADQSVDAGHDGAVESGAERDAEAEHQPAGPAPAPEAGTGPTAEPTPDAASGPKTGEDLEAKGVPAPAPVASDEPDWRPLRRWFLEWFQSRFSDEAPDLDGAVHALQGPDRVSGGWRLRIDLGSAPVEAMSDLVAALEATGARRVRIGDPA